MIRLEGLVKRFDGKPAVDSLELQIARGELCVLLGPSGCGKSTAIRLVNRLLEADEGRVLIDGRDAASMPAVGLRRGIGYVIQSVGLFPHRSVADNIGTVPSLLGWKRERIRGRVAELLDLVGLPADYGRRFPAELSGGEAQRVGVARALAADPPILLMDEPFGALDPLTRARLQGEFRALHARLGTTVLFVTHDVSEALRLCDSLALMREGRIVQRGAPEDFSRAPADPFVADFLGSEYGLLLLGRRSVADLMADRPADAHLPPAAAPGEGARSRCVDITASATVREALAALAASGASSLRVRGAAGELLGELGAAELMAGTASRTGEPR